MRYAQIRKQDISNGEGIRVSLFVTGCNLKCAGCFNEKYQDFNYGIKWDYKIEEEFIKLGDNNFIDGFSILGGEPLLQGKEMLDLVRKIKIKNDKTIWMWTGYKFEKLNSIQRQIIKYVDVLVDGPYIETLKDSNLMFRGSSNQRIIDIKKTLKNKKVIDWRVL
ncbi:MAG: anaerobic ribonucleoside-triphosphate reductase activating protein [Firmicutes bacterium]|nr:anaerobic ribonucleoside-triphosphate reductase activating protein [Bacillota bacterium]